LHVKREYCENISPYTEKLISVLLILISTRKSKENRIRQKGNKGLSTGQAPGAEGMEKIAVKYKLQLFPCAVDFDLESRGIKPGSCMIRR
jgi:hypothetical protein